MLEIFQTLATYQNYKTETNMRVLLSNYRMSEEFPQILLYLGEGGAPVGNEICLNLTPISTLLQSGKELMTKAFPEIKEHY